MAKERALRARPPLRRASPTAPNPLPKRPCRNRLKSLQHKTALVTGAAKRIGRSLALELAGAGARAPITYRYWASEAQAPVEDLRGLNVRATAVRCDVRAPESVTAAIAGVVEQFGRLDVLVNNA